MGPILRVGVVAGFLFFASQGTGLAARLAEPGSDQLLSRPLTVLEHVLIKVQTRVKEFAEAMSDPSYSKKYKPDHSWLRPQVRLYSDRGSGRLNIDISIYIESIDDPWRETCQELLSQSARFLFDTKSPIALGAALMLFDQIQATTEQKMRAYRALVDTMVAELMFFKGNGKEYHARSCKYDLSAKTFTFDEKRGTSK